MSNILSKLYERINAFYYRYLVYVLNSNHHLRYLALRCPYPDLRKKIWQKLGIKVGDGAYINHSITILDIEDEDINIIIGDRVALSPNVILMTYSTPNNSLLKNDPKTKKYIKKGSIVIGNDTWIGAGTIIHPGIKVGERCIIGSMSNLTRDVPDDCLVYGNPAKIIRKLK